MSLKPHEDQEGKGKGRNRGKMAAAASPGLGSSSSSDWSVLRDGCLRCDAEGLRSLCYHPALNAILAVTSRGSIKVIDGTSGAILQASALHGEPQKKEKRRKRKNLKKAAYKPGRRCQHSVFRLLAKLGLFNFR